MLRFAGTLRAQHAAPQHRLLDDANLNVTHYKVAKRYRNLEPIPFNTDVSFTIHFLFYIHMGRSAMVKYGVSSGCIRRESFAGRALP